MDIDGNEISNQNEVDRSIIMDEDDLELLQVSQSREESVTGWVEEEDEGYTGAVRSPIWYYFKRTSQNEAKCKLCSNFYSLGNGESFGYGSLSRHLSAAHIKAFKNYKQEQQNRLDAQKSKPIEKKTSKQITLENAFCAKVWDINDRRAQRLSYKIGEMIALDLQPTTLVEDIGFIRLLKEARPEYQVPCRRYFRDEIIPDIFERCKSQIIEELRSLRYISCTTDIWTADTASEPFLSLTASYFATDKLAEQVLGCIPFSGHHTADTISAKLQERFDEMKILIIKVVAIVTDNAGNITNAVEKIADHIITLKLHLATARIAVAVPQLQLHPGIQLMRSLINLTLCRF